MVQVEGYRRYVLPAHTTWRTCSCTQEIGASLKASLKPVVSINLAHSAYPMHTGRATGTPPISLYASRMNKHGITMSTTLIQVSVP